MIKTKFLASLEFLMAEKGWNKKTLERETGIPYHRLNEWFRDGGKEKPNGSDLETLERVFNVGATFLLSGKTQHDGLELRQQLISRLERRDEDELRELQQYLDFQDQKRRNAQLDPSTP